MSTPDPLQDIVVAALDRLSERFRARDVEGAVACFSPEGAVYGDDLGEHAHGADDLRLFLAELFEEACTLRWEVGETWSRHRGGVLWFVSDAEVVLDYPGGLVERVRLQLSGILSSHGRGWRFELFNGTQPVTQSRDLLVRRG